MYTHLSAIYTFQSVEYLSTVEPPNKDHLGEMAFVPCRETGPISEASFLSLYFTILHLLYSNLTFVCESVCDVRAGGHGKPFDLS